MTMMVMSLAVRVLVPSLILMNTAVLVLTMVKISVPVTNTPSKSRMYALMFTAMLMTTQPVSLCVVQEPLRLLSAKYYMFSMHFLKE